MVTEISGKTELITAIDDSLEELVTCITELDQIKLNTVPYDNSWTAGQLLRHVSKSTKGMSKALLMESKPAERDPGKRIPELKKVFLDFNIKMKSPEMIVPEPGPYDKEEIISEINSRFSVFKENANKANLDELVEGLPLGPVTKLEIVHFIIYHTKRHSHQMKKICEALNNKPAN